MNSLGRKTRDRLDAAVFNLRDLLPEGGIIGHAVVIVQLSEPSFEPGGVSASDMTLFYWADAPHTTTIGCVRLVEHECTRRSFE